VAVACLLLSLLHLGFRHVRSGSSAAPSRVSALSAGAILSLAMTEAGRAPGCQLVVSFQPECPFCRNAAERRRAAPAKRQSEVIWITDDWSPAVAEFVATFTDANTRVVVDDTAFRALHVRAVPGLYVLGPEDQLRWVGPYRGDEDDELLAFRCSRHASGELPGLELP